MELLKEKGFLIDWVKDGQECFDKLEEADEGYYDLILMDIQMPIMDGYTAARKIRALEDPSLARIPIIALSANAFDEDREASYEAGMNAHLAKPIIVSELLDTLGKILFVEK